MKRLHFLLAIPLLFSAVGASAIEIGDFRLDGRAVFGYNPIQGNYYGLGADFYTFVQEHLAAGVGASYTFGNVMSLDREWDVGPFVSYSYPLLEFLVPSIREDLVYVDERDPIYDNNGTAVSSQSYYGMASITSVAMHLFFTRNFGVGVGYRFALGLNNSNLERDHSGFFFGLAIGI